MSSVEDAFESANRQIRTMRQSFALPDAHGVVIFVIESVYFLDPKKTRAQRHLRHPAVRDFGNSPICFWNAGPPSTGFRS